MRLGSVRAPDGLHLVAVKGDEATDLTEAARDLRIDLPVDLLGVILSGTSGLAKVREAYSRADLLYRRSLEQVTFAAPIARPGKVIAFGANYSETPVADRSIPRVFPKWPSTIIGSEDNIIRPPVTSQLIWEVELAVVIGQYARFISVKKALECVFGYTILNDVTARDIRLRKPEQLVLSKNYRTFAPIGAWVITADEVLDPQTFGLRAWLNEELVQDSTASAMIFSVAELISFTSEFVDLEPGDLISTGSPPGIGTFADRSLSLDEGDRVRMELLLGGHVACRLENGVVRYR